MKKLFVLLALVMGAMSVNAQHLGSEYRLKKVIRSRTPRNCRRQGLLLRIGY